MQPSSNRLTVAAVVTQELADVLSWRDEAEFEVARLGTMSDPELLRLLHEQAAGYPSEVLEMLRRFETRPESSPR